MLSPYRVLDLTDERGQLAGLLLAQLGAEVIAVEPPEGSASRRLGPFAGATSSGESLFHLAYNRGKKSVTLDHVDLVELVRAADVLIESGAVAVDLDALRTENPSLITVSISPYGSTGPKCDWLGSDLTVAAASGQMILTGDADRAPVRISEPQAFHHAATDAAMSVVAALIERGRSGVGQHLDVSAQQSLNEAAQVQMLTAPVGAAPTRRRAGGVQIGPYSLRFVYPAKDGFVSITFLFGDMIGRYTQRLVEWVYDSGYCSKELRDLDYISFFALLFSGELQPQTLTDITDAVADFTATMTKAELLHEARQRRLLIAPVTTMEDVAAFEQFSARTFWEDVEIASMTDERHPTVRFPGPWACASRTPLQSLGPPPSIGQHDRELTTPPARRTSLGAAVHPGGRDPGRALDGLKVLDFTWVIAGPMATRPLADHGATVVRIESDGRPDVIRASGPFIPGHTGIDDTGLWHSIGAGKCSVQLDVRHPKSREVLLDLAKWADVVIESFTPGVMASLGLNYDDLAAANPALVMVSTSLMGQTGPYSHFSGFGNLAAAITGFFEITGWPDRPPAGPFMAYTDYLSPKFSALVTLAAVDHARRTGEGQYVDVSQAECALHFLAPALLDWTVNGNLASRRGNDDRWLAPHGVYPAGEPDTDQWIAIVCQDDAQWRRLSTLIGRPDLESLKLDDRLSRREELNALLDTWTLGQEPVELQRRLQTEQVCAHQVQQSMECVADPQLTHRGHFRRVPHPVHGDVWIEGPRVAFSRTPARPAWAGPTLGQHTDHVLREILGYDDDRVTDLVIDGAIQ